MGRCAYTSGGRVGGGSPARAGAGAIVCQRPGWPAQCGSRRIHDTMVPDAWPALARKAVAVTCTQATDAPGIQRLCPPALPMESRQEALVTCAANQLLHEAHGAYAGTPAIVPKQCRDDRYAEFATSGISGRFAGVCPHPVTFFLRFFKSGSC